LLRARIAELHARATNIRRNLVHRLSKYYLETYDLVAIEDLKISNMMKNHYLACSIAHSTYYGWRTTLQYKAQFFGKEVVLVNPRNTSQTCSECGHVRGKNNKLQLSERVFTCPACGTSLDRDFNAAVNILRLIPV